MSWARMSPHASFVHRTVVVWLFMHVGSCKTEWEDRRGFPELTET